MNTINLWNKALDILSRREHSSYELKTKLKKFETDEKDLNQLIQKLKASNFIDDEKLLVVRIGFDDEPAVHEGCHG